MFRELPWAPQGIWKAMEGMALFINISPQGLSGPPGQEDGPQPGSAVPSPQPETHLLTTAALQVVGRDRTCPFQFSLQILTQGCCDHAPGGDTQRRAATVGARLGPAPCSLLPSCPVAAGWYFADTELPAVTPKPNPPPIRDGSWCSPCAQEMRLQGPRVGERPLATPQGASPSLKGRLRKEGERGSGQQPGRVDKAGCLRSLAPAADSLALT